MRIHRLVAEMVALDDQSFHLVYNEGFIRLLKTLEPRYTLPSDTWLRETMVPRMYAAVKDKVAALLDGTDYLSFTTDAWTTTMCTDSLLSLTCHWINQEWERKSAILQASHLQGSHTADNIKTTTLKMLEDWGMTDKVHVFLRDNAANQTKGLNDAGVQSLPCFAHTVQLCVNKGLESQQMVVNVVTACKKIATHFSHSRYTS
jgi:hypothetical protein